MAFGAGWNLSLLRLGGANFSVGHCGYESVCVYIYIHSRRCTNINININNINIYIYVREPFMYYLTRGLVSFRIPYSFFLTLKGFKTFGNLRGLVLKLLNGPKLSKF